MLGFYNYTVVLTYLGMLSAFAGILSAADGNVDRAMVCLMAAGVFDMFDGRVARTMERTKDEKRFGIQIDSLSDLISFGVLPALILYRLTEKSPDGILTAGLYVLCALIRLAYFNVMEEKRQDEEEGPRTCYQGLPVTVSAVLLPIVCWIQDFLGIVRGAGSVFLMLCMLFFFLFPIKIQKPHSPVKLLLSVFGIGGLVFLLGGGT